MSLRLTRTQRSLLVAGETPKLEFAGPPESPPVEVGEIIVLTKNVRLEITELRRTAENDYSLGYTLHNERLGSRFLANQHGQTHPEQYVSSPAGGIDTEAGEAVDDFTQKRITREARAKEAEQGADVLVAAENVLDALRERAEVQPSLKRAEFPIRRELDRFIKREKRKAA